MIDFEKILADEGISEYGIADFNRLNVINGRLLTDSAGIKSALVFLIPYRRRDTVISDGLNAGLFARCRDYHQYAKQLCERLKAKLSPLIGGAIYGFADNSPIDEKDAAEKCGIGFIGRNGLIINEKYGSFVFIAELLFTVGLPEHKAHISGGCGSCSICVAACPAGALESSGFCREKCLSAISQKKEKTPSELKKLYETSTIWGCDKCQAVCPYNKNAEFSDIDYFRDGFISSFSSTLLDNMDKNTYESYSFSYRKKRVIKENCLTVENNCDIIT